MSLNSFVTYECEPYQGVISLVTFFGRAKKVTSTGLAGVVPDQKTQASPAGRNTIED
jgi:hypothetical protein